MKKFIYGFTILLGIGLISTNFIISDTSNIDHKTVKAGGTACKWISESGYGLGPYYVTPSTITNANDTFYNQNNNNIYIAKTSITNAHFNLLQCNVSQSGIKKDGYKIYDSDGNLYSTNIKIGSEYVSTNEYVYLNTNLTISGINTPTSYIFFKIKDGSFDLFEPSKNGSGTAFLLYDGTYEPTIEGIEKYKTLFARYTLTNLNPGSSTVPVLVTGEYETDINNDGEWTFTCVCAEY